MAPVFFLKALLRANTEAKTLNINKEFIKTLRSIY
jgi:hypothetical protein